MTRRPVHIFGVPSDSNSSFLRGAAKAPASIRAALGSSHGNAAAENGLEIGREIALVDLGDISISENEADDARIAETVCRITEEKCLPLAIGGDHWITAPIVMALAEIHGPMSILHIDAHPDLYDDMDGNPRSHASPFARILERGAAKNLVQVGVRTVNALQRKQAARFGVVHQISARQLGQGPYPVLAGPLYVSIDMDGFDPSVAPGVSHHEPGGLTVREVLDLLDRQSAWLAGADIVELNPDRDLNDVTATLGAKLVREIAAMFGAA
ncbi:MAG: agmatinase family protein [Sphingomonadales bacterium]|nr:MAG: agmatinase family protein [Sphingomonadales bacterium]